MRIRADRPHRSAWVRMDLCESAQLRLADPPRGSARARADPRASAAPASGSSSTDSAAGDLSS